MDILAEFCTQTNVENGTGFDIHFHETPTESEVEIIKQQLINWNNLNDFDKRLFKIFRNVLKYGDFRFILILKHLNGTGQKWARLQR